MIHFLLVPYQEATASNYQHQCVGLAEGLVSLSIPFTANINYYNAPNTSEYLFKPINDSSDAYDKIQYIITEKPEKFKPQLEQFHEQNKKIVILDNKDEWIRHVSTDFLKICHKYFMSTCQLNIALIKPLCFSLTTRMIDTITSPKPWAERSNSIFVSHRVTNHAIRNYVISYYDKAKINIHNFNDKFSEPTDSVENHWWRLTGRRHSVKYYEAVQAYKFIDAHGGYFKNNTLTKLYQWDSWKFWEGFLCGCAVISADLDYYRIKLPFPLVPYKHYIPVRYDALQDSYTTLYKFTDAELESIAVEGRKYVLEHYSPENMAKYILENIQYV